MPEASLWSFIANADIVVKGIMLILFFASLASWTFIFQRRQHLRSVQQATQQFLHVFDQHRSLEEMERYAHTRSHGLAALFKASIDEFNQPNVSAEATLSNIDRAMQVAQLREMDTLEQSLSFLATVGSTSPYVGLFGTVWGIMSAFRALGAVQQATVAMVAPGIAEALIATAIGLFAAIPAVIAYNRFSNQLARIQNQFDAFRSECLNFFQRQLV